MALETAGPSAHYISFEENRPVESFLKINKDQSKEKEDSNGGKD